MENKIRNAILLVKPFLLLENKVTLQCFFWYILFTSSQNFGIFKENSQACAGKQVKYVVFMSDCSFSG